jgi:hypothetical protein
VASELVPAIVLGGTKSPSFELRFDAGLLLPGGQLELMVDDDGAGASLQSECDEADNSATWPEALCL